MSKTSELVKKSAGEREPDAKLLTKAQATRLEQGFLNDLSLADSSLVSAAIKLKEFVDGRGYEPLGYKTLTEWRIARVAQTEFYNLRSVSKLLDAGVPTEAVQNMKLTNIRTLAEKLPETAWTDKKWQRDAIDLPVDQFEAKVAKASAEAGMHFEDATRRGFVLPKSLAEKWDTAMRVAEIIDGAKNQESRIEAILSEYLNASSSKKGLSKLQRYEEIQNAEL